MIRLPLDPRQAIGLLCFVCLSRFVPGDSIIVLNRAKNYAALIALTALAAACATPPHDLWPPRPGEPTIRVTVYGTAMHSLISLPIADGSTSGALVAQDASATATATASAAIGYEEWAYGQRLWFYDAEESAGSRLRYAYYRTLGVLSAFFWPSAGVVQLTRAGQDYQARNPQEPCRSWRLELSVAGCQRMRAYLEASIVKDGLIERDGPTLYYIAAHKYHVFYNCHHYVACALREAGIPLSPWRCLIPSGLWRQLDKYASGPRDVPISAGFGHS